MDRNWNRNGGGGGATGGEKMYSRQSYSSGGGGGGGSHYHHHSNNYRKKNDYSSQEFYAKTVKQVVQPIKKESLQVASVEDELMSANFSWIKNSPLN